MNRFRVTFIAVCCVLAWLAYTDLSLLLRNPQPLSISIRALESMPAPPREWLTVADGYPQLLQGINMTGSMEFSAFLIPLTSSPDSDQFTVWVETRDPKILDALSIYYFNLESETQRQEFLEQHADLFSHPRSITGMTASNLVASSNQRQLVKLLEQMGVVTTETPIFISENKQPAIWRGVFYAVVALAGFLKLALDQRNKTKTQP